MKKSIKFLYSLLILPLLSCFALSGCTLDDVNDNINEGFDEEDYYTPNYNFSISASLDNIEINISNVGTEGETAILVALPVSQYMYGEENIGVAEYTGVSPVEIAAYSCGTSQTIKVDRYKDDIDGIYYKYYIMSAEDEILAGPMFCTEIEPIFKHDDPVKPKNIKGIMCEDDYRSAVKDLGCSYTEINFVMDWMFVPNEIVVNGQIQELQYTETKDAGGNLFITCKQTGRTDLVDYIDYNGQRYYFRLNEGGGASLNFYDNIIRNYTRDGVRVTLIMLMHYKADQYLQPYYLKYPATALVSSSRYVQVNTSNPYGAGYWGAFMEFLGKRYSEASSIVNCKQGLVQSFVIGNEIDMPSLWNNIVAPNQPNLTLENYMEEYEREMRIANLALKKYYLDNTVLVSLTNHWTKKWEDYAPKDMLDYLTSKTMRQGNYDYGFAIHPYGININNPAFWQGDTSAAGMNGSLNTSCITWSNLEVLQLYLEQPAKLCNGQIRPVYLTEGGVSSSSIDNTTMFEATKNQQAAGVAYIYYKCTQLPCIKALIYYRLIDNVGESAYFGLMSGNLTMKPAYRLYKFIDTEYSFEASDPYLEYIEWSVWIDGKSITFGQKIGNVTSFQDTMTLFPSRFDWSKNWNTDLITTRKADQPFYQ